MILVCRIMDDLPNSPNLPAIRYTAADHFEVTIFKNLYKLVSSLQSAICVTIEFPLIFDETKQISWKSPNPRNPQNL